jgi:RNA polymerase sigma-70 factor (ECF subfamily)
MRRKSEQPAEVLAAAASHAPLDKADEPDEALVARCLQGQDGAFERLYRRHAERIYRHLWILVGNQEDAEDGLQQTFLQAFRSLHRFAGKSKLSTWLHGISVRVALNILRARRRRGNAMERFGRELRLPGAAQVDGRLMAREDLVRLDRHLGELPADRQVAFLLYYVEQLELREVAQSMGMNEARIWARIKRARNAIVEAIEREDAARGGSR